MKNKITVKIQVIISMIQNNLLKNKKEIIDTKNKKLIN